jgi:hypothetical protein
MNITSLVCPEPGRWRAWLDNADGTGRFDSHLETCPDCQRVVADLRQDAVTASSAIAELPLVRPTDTETAAARERLVWRQRVPAAARVSAPIARHWSWGLRAAGASVAAAVLVSAVVAFTPEGRTAAAGFLSQFRSRQVVAIEVSPQSQADISETLMTLSNLGTLEFPNGRREIGSTRGLGMVTVAEASREVGFPVQTPDPATLPASVDRTPRVQVIPANEIRFTFDKAKAQRYLESSGQPQVNLPDKFNGAKLIVSTPAAAMLEYSAKDTHQMLMIGQAGELVIDVQGQVTLDELRDFLLGMPGLPPETVRQLKQIRNWKEALPVPIRTDQIHWQPETFTKDNSRGLLLNDNTGVGSAAIWQSGGKLYGVAGSVKASELKRVADSLAVR